jgi:glycosyltransferase involved in cell wall biosynthesis
MIRVLMFGEDSKSGGVAIHTKNLTKELLAEEVSVISYNFSGSDMRKTYQRIVGIFQKAIRDRKEYDIIHVQSSGGIFSFISAISGTLVSNILNKRCVVTFHYSGTQAFIKDYHQAFKFVYDRSDKLILVSNKQQEAILSRFQKAGQPGTDKTVVLPNGFNSDLFHARDKNACRDILKLSKDKQIVFNVSNLIETKGHTYLLSAMQDIVSRNGSCLCFIAGMGVSEPKLKAQIEDLKLQNNVTLLGWIPYDQIPIWINAADVFVSPSLAEGNPIIMFEVLGCGKPFIGTKVGGIPEIITSNKYGLLAEPADPKGLADIIQLALDREWNNDEILQYGIQFTWNRVAKDTKSVYDQVLQEKAGQVR